MTRSNPLIVAIDVNDLPKAIGIATTVAPHCFGFKFGLEFFCAYGASGIHAVLDNIAARQYRDNRSTGPVQHMPFMLDLKLHDIPSTVGKTIAILAKLTPWAITVHAAGGSDMIRAAAEASGPDTRILAVTLLTSSLKNDADAAIAVHDLANIAVRGEADGVVCSALDAPVARSVIRHRLIVCPGIRLMQDGETEQRRIATPRQAIAADADYIVVGRPITQDIDPAAVAKRIAEEAMS